MADVNWNRAWRGWLRARFGGRLSGRRLEEAMRSAEGFRAMAGHVTAVPLDNGETPFSDPLPAGRRGGPR